MSADTEDGGSEAHPAHDRAAVRRDVEEFANLGDGWDGEAAARPSGRSVADALAFLDGEGRDRALEASLHVDGTVILEDDRTSFRFPGDGTVVWADDLGHDIRRMAAPAGDNPGATA